MEISPSILEWRGGHEVEDSRVMRFFDNHDGEAEPFQFKLDQEIVTSLEEGPRSMALLTSELVRIANATLMRPEPSQDKDTSDGCHTRSGFQPRKGPKSDKTPEGRASCRIEPPRLVA